MPNRILREGILSSERVCALGWAEEVFYRRLMSAVDDYGRFPANTKILRAALYPLQIDKVSDSDVEKWLACAQKAALVRVYPAPDGKRYLELLNFRQQARAKASKYPSSDEQAHSECAADATHMNGTRVADAQHPIADAHLGVSVFVDGGVPAHTRRKKPQKVALPDDFGISERVQAWAKKNGLSRLDEHLEAFKRKARARAYEYADWDDAFMEAVREDWAKLRGAQQAGQQRSAVVDVRGIG